MGLMVAALIAFGLLEDATDLTGLVQAPTAKLGLPWVAKRNLTVAVLFAFFGGMFGLHHFYTGHTRRALWYLAFFWLGFPIVLGWIDAVRLALPDDTQFQVRLGFEDAKADGPVLS